MSLTLAIVGRPNVGKSTLFNRLAGKRLALVHDEPGVTRDRREAEGQLGDLTFTIIDTAGFDDTGSTGIGARALRQTELALQQADVALFVVDARAGLTAEDERVARHLRKTGKPVILVANKCDSRAGQQGLADAYGLGFGEPVGISAAHGDGLDALYDALKPFAAAAGRPSAAAAPPLRLAVVGRPNVGKSTLVNALLGSERFVTGPEAGITRDAIGVTFAFKGRLIKIFDTAGLRRKARVVAPLEKLSAADTLRAIKFAEVVVLVIDATAPFEKQDLAIADLLAQEGRAVVLAVNKWDLVSRADAPATRKAILETLETHLSQIRGVPLVTLSAVTGEGVERLMPAVLEAHRRWQRRVPTAVLNRWLEEAVQKHPPPMVHGRTIRLRYATQAKTRPPTVVIFASRPSDVPDSYVRYLANSLRDVFGLDGVPLRLNLRKGANPFAK